MLNKPKAFCYLQIVAIQRHRYRLPGSSIFMPLSLYDSPLLLSPESSASVHRSKEVAICWRSSSQRLRSNSVQNMSCTSPRPRRVGRGIYTTTHVKTFACLIESHRHEAFAADRRCPCILVGDRLLHRRSDPVLPIFFLISASTQQWKTLHPATAKYVPPGCLVPCILTT